VDIIQYSVTAFCNRDGVCFLRGTSRVFKYSLGYLYRCTVHFVETLISTPTNAHT